MQKHLAVAGLSAIVLFAGVVFLGGNRFGLGTSQQSSEQPGSHTAHKLDPGLSDAAQRIELPTELSNSIDPSDEGLGPEKQKERDALVDGTVLREWGTFVKAKDVRTNCRDVREVVRHIPQPQDHVRKCDSKTIFDHPYALFTDEQLEQIASYDAAAAYLLAYRMLMQPRETQRIDNPEKALTYALRALIWTGEKQAYDLLVDGRHFTSPMVWSTLAGTPTQREVGEREEQYVWLKAGRDLGFVAESDFQWQEVSRQMARYDEYFDIEALNKRATQLSQHILKGRSLITSQP